MESDSLQGNTAWSWTTVCIDSHVAELDSSQAVESAVKFSKNPKVANTALIFDSIKFFFPGLSLPWEYKICLKITHLWASDYQAKMVLLKGTVQRDFWPPVFFIIQTSLGHWPTGSNIFEFGSVFAELFKFYESPLGMILRRGNLPGVSYCAESITLGYHTLVSHLLKFVLKSPRGIIPWWVIC